jgi:hypothetical protein
MRTSPTESVPLLKAAGHDAVHVAEIGLTSADDQVILDHARDQDRGAGLL